MREIIGDDYPTYEDSVKMTLAEREQAKTTDKDILLSRVLHRLACIEDDIKIVARHIENNCNEIFYQPSLNKDGSVFADEAWHNIGNIEIACDLNSNESLDWENRVKSQENKV